MLKIDWNPDVRKLREFGFFALAGFGLVAAVVAHRSGLLHGHAGPVAKAAVAILAALALACPLLALARPQALRPIWLTLVFVTAPIGFVVGNLVMAIVYWGVVTPIGLALRVASNDPMHRKMLPDADTYWRPRPPAPAKPRYFRQF